MSGRPGADAPISVCVINWQGEDRITATVAAVLADNRFGGEVFVIDAASTDRSVGIVEAAHPGVAVVRLEENRGPAYSRNRGLACASHDRVLFFDNDVAPERGCVDALMSALDQDPEATLALPRVRLSSAPGRVQFEGAETHVSGYQLLLEQGTPADAPVGGSRCVGSMVSACFLLDRSRPGGATRFDEAFAFDYEDHDFGRRVRLAGGRILAVPSATCLHGAGTAGRSVRGGGAFPPGRFQRLAQGRWWIVLTTYRLRTLVLLSPILVGFDALQLALAARRGRIREWFDALRWIAGHRAEIGRRRAEVAAGRRVSDRDTLVAGPLPFRPELGRGPFEAALLASLRRATNGYWALARRLL